MKRFCLILIIFGLLSQASYAKDLEVQIKPISKITTSNVSLKEGDNVDFFVANDVYLNSKLYLKSGEKVEGTITSLKNNSFSCEDASLYIENFVANDIDGKRTKLKGIIYKKGNDHWMITQFIPIFYVFIRGGEVQIEPSKDTFTLYLGDRL